VRVTLLTDLRANLSTARLNRHEISGSLGDLGTFLPLLVGLSVVNGVNFATALFFAGLFNVVTGLVFSIPLAVQPMKAIAVVALTEGLTPGQIAAAGAAVGLVVLILGASGLINVIDRLIPRSVVRGLQLALGLSLAIKAIGSVLDTQTAFGFDSYFTGAVAAIIVVVLTGSKHIPSALVLFAGGVLLTLIASPHSTGGLSLGLTIPHFAPPTLLDVQSSFAPAALPQIPLTVLNSVIAVCVLSSDLFPDARTTPRRVATSVGLMNLVGVWFAAMPMCHGSGGLAAQHRFGARTNGSIIFLGTTKVLLALLAGASLISVCDAFPKSILGVMLAFAGVELALVARDQTTRRDASAMLITTAAILGTQHIAIGLAIGLVLVFILRLVPQSRAGV